MSFAGKKVLVVDDNAMNRELLTQELEDEGFEVRTANDGAEGAELARNFEPDVIILDIMMPRVDGIETCRRVRAHPVTENIPVIFLTGHGVTHELTMQALEAGGNDFLQKPYTPAILFARLRSQLTISETQRALRGIERVDELTGLPSKRDLFERMHTQIKSLARGGPPILSCLIVDVDNLRAINERAGQGEGDAALQAVARSIKQAVRETDMVARYQGEVFVVLLPSTDLKGAATVAEKLRLNVEYTSGVTVSIGVSSNEIPTGYDANTASRNDAFIKGLLATGDDALKEAKRAGRNCVRVQS